MKTRSDLLLRDALATVFVRGAAGDAAARRALEELDSWSPASPPGPALGELRSEDETPLFEADGPLTEKFAGLEGYVRDRARRFTSALAWIQEDGATGDPIACASAAWDAGLFFEVHELLEPVWLRTRGEQRDVLRGLIMAGAAMHHLVSGNRAGARGLLRDGARHLGSLPGATPLDLESFARSLLELASAIDSGEIRGPDDVVDPPRLERR